MTEPSPMTADERARYLAEHCLPGASAPTRYTAFAALLTPIDNGTEDYKAAVKLAFDTEARRALFQFRYIRRAA